MINHVILAVRFWSWSELEGWSFGGELIRVLFNIFFSIKYSHVLQLSYYMQESI